MFTTKPGSSLHSLYIYCELLTDLRPSVLFHLHGGVEVPESQDEQFTGRVQCDKDVLREGRLRLHVSRLRTDDSGLYMCEVFTNYGSSTATCRLTVTGTFVVNVTQTSYQAEENHNITLEWMFTTKPGSSLHSLYIYCELLTDLRTTGLFHLHGGVEVQTGEHFTGRVQCDKDVLREGRLRLHVSRLRTDDSGLYMCEVDTRYGGSTATCRLNVTAAADEPKPQRPTESPQPESPQPESRGRIGLYVGLGLAAALLIVCTIFAVKFCLSKSTDKKENDASTDTEAAALPLTQQLKTLQFYQEKMMCIILLLINLTSCVCGTFVVNVTQTSYQAEENHNITLEWMFTTKPGSSLHSLYIYCELLTDLRASVLYDLHGGVEVPESQDEQFTGRVQCDKDVLREGRLRLHVSRLRTDDSGLYMCEVLTRDGGSTATCRLNVTGTFVVNVTQTSYQAEENHNITLEWMFTTKPGSSLHSLYIYCELLTDLRPSVLFHLHEGVEVPESQDEQFTGRVQCDKDVLREGRLRLHVSRLRTDDSGLYMCEVSTRHGGSTATCRLTVTAAADEPKPQRPTESPQPESPQPESPQPESPQPESPQPESPQPESPQPESPQPESPQPESRGRIVGLGLVAALLFVCAILFAVKVYLTK
ncbi:hypothetical protein ABVT39_026335 [Epinephelus coioides]